ARETPSAKGGFFNAVRLPDANKAAADVGKLAGALSKVQETLEELKRAEAEAARTGAADDGRRARVQVQVGSGRSTGFIRTSGEETTEEKLTDRMIEGVWATGVRRTTTLAKGAIGNEQPIKTVSEEWTSPDLQVLVLTDRNDPRSGRSTYRLQRVAL